MWRESSKHNRLLAKIEFRLQGMEQAKEKAKVTDVSNNGRCDEDNLKGQKENC